MTRTVLSPLFISLNLEKSTSGKFIYEGLDLYKEAYMEDIRKFRFSFIFQAYNLIPELNVKDNIMMPNYIAKKKDTKRFMELVDRLGLERQVKQMPETLSGGEQQRAAIARALMNRRGSFLQTSQRGIWTKKTRRT